MALPQENLADNVLLLLLRDQQHVYHVNEFRHGLGLIINCWGATTATVTVTSIEVAAGVVLHPKEFVLLEWHLGMPHLRWCLQVASGIVLPPVRAIPRAARVIRSRIPRWHALETFGFPILHHRGRWRKCVMMRECE